MLGGHYNHQIRYLRKVQKFIVQIVKTKHFIRRRNLHYMKRFIVFSTDKVFSLDDLNDNFLELSEVIISLLKRNNILERWVSIQCTKAKN